MFDEEGEHGPYHTTRSSFHNPIWRPSSASYTRRSGSRKL